MGVSSGEEGVWSLVFEEEEEDDDELEEMRRVEVEVGGGGGPRSCLGRFRLRDDADEGGMKSSSRCEGGGVGVGPDLAVRFPFPFVVPRELALTCCSSSSTSSSSSPSSSSASTPATRTTPRMISSASTTTSPSLVGPREEEEEEEGLGSDMRASVSGRVVGVEAEGVEPEVLDEGGGGCWCWGRAEEEEEEGLLRFVDGGRLEEEKEAEGLPLGKGVL